MAIKFPPSRAASLHLAAGQTALDFANTASGRGSPSHQEHMQTPENVVDWACHAGIIQDHGSKRLRLSILRDRAQAMRLKREALELRDAVYEAGVAIAQGGVPALETLAQLSRRHGKAAASAELKAEGAELSWRWRSGLDSVLGPLALSAIDLLMRHERLRIKQCAGQECGWLFYDRTKNNNRRWCAMSVCGNRAKARAARRRMQDAPP